MAKFDESKIITPLHPEKSEVGKKYYFSDDLLRLKDYVENDTDRVGPLGRTSSYEDIPEFPFYIICNGSWKFLYSYEEPPKQRMTYFQLMEWLAKGNGFYTNQDNCASTSYMETIDKLNEEVDKTILIRPFGQTEWIEPTYEIYLKDCKGGNK